MGKLIGGGTFVVLSLWGATFWFGLWILASWDCFEGLAAPDSFQCSQTADSLAIGLFAFTLLATLVLAGFILWAALDALQRRRANQGHSPGDGDDGGRGRSASPVGDQAQARPERPEALSDDPRGVR